jgi:hypothetical protein
MGCIYLAARDELGRPKGFSRWRGKKKGKGPAAGPIYMGRRGQQAMQPHDPGGSDGLGPSSSSSHARSQGKDGGGRGLTCRVRWSSSAAGPGGGNSGRCRGRLGDVLLVPSSSFRRLLLHSSRRHELGGGTFRQSWRRRGGG